MLTREELELRKLELEAKHLATPTFKTATFWISVASALIAVVGVLAQYQLSKIEAAQAKLDKTEAEQLRDKAKLDKDAAEALRDKAKQETDKLVAQQASLTKQNEGLTDSISKLTRAKQIFEQDSLNREKQVNRLVAAVKATPAATQSPELRAATTVASNSSFIVGLYSLGLPPDQVQKAKVWLQEHGYALIASETLTARTQWLSAESTVLFYSASARAQAERLAVQPRSGSRRQNWGSARRGSWHTPWRGGCQPTRASCATKVKPNRVAGGV